LASASAALGAKSAPDSGLSASEQVLARFPYDPVIWRAAAPEIQATDPVGALHLLAAASAELAGTQIESAWAKSNRTANEAASHLVALMLEGRGKEAVDYIDGLATEERAAPSVQERRAALLAAGGQWSALHAALNAGAWGAADAGALRLAFAARSASEIGHSDLAADLWEEALREGLRQPSTAEVLLRLALDWKNTPAAAATFDALLQTGGARPWVLEQFRDWARQQGDDASWTRFAAAWHRAEPANAQAAALWARLTLLGEDATGFADAVAIAESQPADDPDGVSLRALALHREQRDREAVAALETLSLSELSQPRPALYYAGLLAKSQPTTARRFLEQLSGAKDLLPAEAAWLEQLRQQLGLSSKGTVS
jgi:hypothetical protein